jgi:hypothetical protein
MMCDEKNATGSLLKTSREKDVRALHMVSSARSLVKIVLVGFAFGFHALEY